MSKHTPGPWEAHWIDDCWKIANYSRNAHIVAVCTYGCRLKGKDISPGEANARLIAAAPDMLEALEWARVHIEERDGERSFPDVLPNIIAAIAKARGNVC